MCMEANKLQIQGIFNGSRLLEIPFYQRSYVWGESQWIRFLEDMEYVTAAKRPYFVGSIILKAYVGATSEGISEHRIVIDGQQRLTTFMIFFKVLCMKMGKSGLFERDFVLETGDIALEHGRNDVAAFKEAMSASEAVEIDLANRPKSQILEAYNWFVRNVDPEKVSRDEIKKSIQFVCIDLGQDEDEQQIFDTINSLGVQLTTAELLKNHLFNRDNVEEYEQHWVTVFEKDDETKAYWDRTVHAGRFERSLIDLFFDSFLQIQAREPRFEVSAEDRIAFNRNDQLFNSYKTFISKYLHGDKAGFLAKMKEYAILFRKVFDPLACKRPITGEHDADRMNVVVFGMELLTLVPYVLYVCHEVGDEGERSRIFALLESYVMRRIIVRANNRSYGNLFLSFVANSATTADELYGRLDDQDDQTAYIPRDDQFGQLFSETRLTNKVAKGVLYLIESAVRPAESSTSLLGFDSYSLEHMMPKKWRNNWDGPASGTDEARARDAKLLTLGNLAIITQSLNASVRDSAWDKKLSGKNGKPGLKECASGLSTMYDVLSRGAWAEDGIDERAGKLCRDALGVWKLLD